MWPLHRLHCICKKRRGAVVEHAHAAVTRKVGLDGQRAYDVRVVEFEIVRTRGIYGSYSFCTFVVKNPVMLAQTGFHNDAVSAIAVN